jgi:NhaP-type Na+/H+ or K+/H+ antiporter
MDEHIIVSLAVIGLLGIMCQWFAWIVKLPAILFLLLAGIVAGPVTGWLNPERLFGDLLFPVVSLSVAIILFEGALTLKFHEIRGLEKVVRNLSTFGLAATWIITTVATHYAIGFTWELSFLFGALTSVTGPTVIVPMLRTVRPNAKISNILRWEGIVIDPIGALLAVLVYGYIIAKSAGLGPGYTFINFGQTIIVGLLIGAASGYLFGIILRRHWLPEFLHNVAALTFVCALFTLSNVIRDESGLLTVTVMGIWLANMKNVSIEDILDFKESLSVLLISVLFIVLAARVEFAQLYELGMMAGWVFVAIQFIARPFKVFISTLGSSLSWAERAMIGWIAPRGIVAAAVASLFAIRLEQIGYQNASLLAPMTFLIIIGTVVLQSATARPIANALKVAEPEPKGFLIIGANVVARTIAKALVANDFRVLLTDTYWENIKTARMEGLPTYYGNPISEHADRHLDLVGLGNLMALSPQKEVNILASLRYRIEFGRKAVYSLQTSEQQSAPEKLKASTERRGKILFGQDVTFSKLASLLSQDAEIRSTKLTETFKLDEYMKKHGAKAIPMFAIDPAERLRIFTAGEKPEPKADWTLISLMRNEDEVRQTP